jgi:hypothetical protein
MDAKNRLIKTDTLSISRESPFEFKERFPLCGEQKGAFGTVDVIYGVHSKKVHTLLKPNIKNKNLSRMSAEVMNLICSRLT